MQRLIAKSIAKVISDENRILLKECGKKLVSMVIIIAQAGCCILIRWYISFLNVVNKILKAFLRWGGGKC